MSLISISLHRSVGNRSLSKQKRGFALLITITLLAFLVLLLVSLATLTRVETQVAFNNQTISQARQNAMLALNIAIGQLQQYAGPDPVVTGTAELTASGSVQNPVFTGVWNSTATGVEPAMYLVSGSEKTGATASALFTATDPSTDIAAGMESTSNEVFLVGDKSVALDPSTPTAAEKRLRVKVSKQDIVAPAGVVPGVAVAETPRIGRYAWWIGDQGGKASLGLADLSARVNYAPWTSVAMARRIRQQIGVGPSYFRTNSAVTSMTTLREGFDPFATTNANVMSNLVSPTQIGFLTPAGSTTQANFMKGHFHDFTTSAYSVLANTLPASNPNRGLLTDLSLNPTALGTAFAAYADYETYMEAPNTTTPGAPAVLPTITSVDSPRRRYKMVPPITNAATGLPEITFSTVPVISGFYLQFAISKSSATAATATLQSRLFVSLWNPYSTSFAPSSTNGLSVDVQLPTIMAEGQSIDLNQLPGSMSSGGVLLPFGSSSRHNDSASGNFGAPAEMASWLPGRIYSWTTNPSSVSTANTALGFYSNLLGSSWSRNFSVPSSMGRYPALEIPASTVIVRLKLNGSVVSTYSVKYDPQSEGAGTQPWRFGFAFRLNQPQASFLDRGWLKEYDPRQLAFTQTDVPSTSSKIIVPFNTDSATSSDPLVYSETAKITSTTGGNYLVSPLLYRIQGMKASAMSVFNDISLFELPRSPILSLGELQHLQVKDKRPFSIGNSWGDTANVVYDRFFFSGIPKTGTHPDLSAGVAEPLPNWNMRPIGADSVAVIRSDSAPADAGLSSRYILQGGGFNINSTSVAAWRAVLSSLRFPSSAPFVSVAIDNTMSNSSVNAGTQNGTATQSQTFDADTTIGTIGTASAPVFFRFPQSAQEVFYWAKPSQSGDNERKFITSAFRIGVRGYNNGTVANGFIGETGTTWTSTAANKGTRRQDITIDQVELLAREIVARLRLRSSTKGPFRSLQEFLSEVDGSTKESLLEAAINAAGLNSAQVAPLSTATALANSGFSTLTLTQADILNVLAPYLRNRSDTFVVRTYGEVVNPVTGTVDAKAWAEATVQRFPETVASGDSITQPAQPFGRRFKITNFRWLTSTDI